MVGAKYRFAIFAKAHFIGIFNAGQLGGFKAIADFYTLDRIDCHHRLGQIGIKFVIDRITQPNGNARTDNFDHSANR